MKNSKFFTVPYEFRNTASMNYLRREQGGVRAVGQWFCLLSILYEQNGGINLSNEVWHKVIEAELELTAEKLDDFIQTLTEIGWVDASMWKKDKHVIAPGVLDQLEFKKSQGEKRRGAKQE